MALNDEEKLKNFETEAMSDVQKIYDEIVEKTKEEYQEKVEAGEKKLLADIYEFVQSEIEKIRKEKNLEVSRTGMQQHHEYLKYSGKVTDDIYIKVRERLGKFLKSDGYFDYLKKSCMNAINAFGTQIDILYMPKDTDLVEKLKAQLANELKNTDISCIKFIADSEIKNGGLRFYNAASNILINDIIDEKLERSKDMLNAIIGPFFKEANET